MDPKNNPTQTPPTDDETQPTDQQKADGELVVSHETEVDANSVGDVSSADSPLSGMDASAPFGDGSDSTSTGTDVGNGTEAMPGGAPVDPFAAPEAEAPAAAPMPDLTSGADQTMPPTTDAAPAPEQPVQPMLPPEQSQPFPPAAPMAGPGVTPPAPIDPNAPAPAMPPIDTNAPMPITDHKNRAMMITLILVAAVVVLAVGIYALTAL